MILREAVLAIPLPLEPVSEPLCAFPEAGEGVVGSIGGEVSDPAPALVTMPPRETRGFPMVLPLADLPSLTFIQR